MKYKKGLFVYGILYTLYLLSIIGVWNLGAEEADAKITKQEAPRIALTFDDGPSRYTEELLNGLGKRDVKAREEIGKTSELLERLTGCPVEFVRPPFGLWQKKLEQEMAVIPVMWSIDPLDWTTENVDEIVNKVVTEAEENDIILLHDCYKSSVEATFRIVDILQKEGFEFVTVDELLLD